MEEDQKFSLIRPSVGRPFCAFSSCSVAQFGDPENGSFSTFLLF